MVTGSYCINLNLTLLSLLHYYHHLRDCNHYYVQCHKDLEGSLDIFDVGYLICPSLILSIGICLLHAMSLSPFAVGWTKHSLLTELTNPTTTSKHCILSIINFTFLTILNICQ